MLSGEKKPKVTTKETDRADEYEALQSFLRSISSTATLPPYVKGETFSSFRGVFNQVGVKILRLSNLSIMPKVN